MLSGLRSREAIFLKLEISECPKRQAEGNIGHGRGHGRQSKAKDHKRVRRPIPQAQRDKQDVPFKSAESPFTAVAPEFTGRLKMALSKSPKESASKPLQSEPLQSAILAAQLSSSKPRAKTQARRQRDQEKRTCRHGKITKVTQARGRGDDTITKATFA